MSYDDRPTANVKDIEGAGLEYTDDKGQLHAYSQARNVWLTVSQLQERVNIRPPDKDHTEPHIERSVFGVADLDRDRSISIAGAPKTLTRSIPFSIRAGPWQRPQRPADTAEADVLSLNDGTGWGLIGFSSADWEIGNEDSWFLECYTTEAVLQGLLDAVATGRVTLATMGLQYVRGLYQDEGEWAPPSARRHLFLRPSRSENRTDMPETANGELTGIHLTLAPPLVGLSTPSNPKEDGFELEESRQEQPAPVNSVTETMSASTLQIVAAVERLRTTLRWLIAAGFLAAVAMFVR